MRNIVACLFSFNKTYIIIMFCSHVIAKMNVSKLALTNTVFESPLWNNHLAHINSNTNAGACPGGGKGPGPLPPIN